MKLFRAAADDIITDCGSFAETLETASVYLDNPGFGGARLWSVDVDPEHVLDLVGADDAVAVVADAIGASHPGAIGADEYVPRVSYRLQAAGYDWVRVAESYPAGTVTWIYVGADDLDLSEVA